jgi:replicative DNA helicase
METQQTEIRVQPHNVEAEEGLLACLLFEDAASDTYADAIMAGINDQSFFKTSHQVLFSAIASLNQDGKPVHEITLLDKLRKEGTEDQVGGIAAIYALQNRVETCAHCKFFARIVAEKAALRRIIRTSRKAIEAAWDQSADSMAIVARTEQEFRDISERVITTNTMLSAKELVAEARDALDDKMNNPDRVPDTIATHMTELNDALPGGGLTDGNFVVLAARPSVGKTALAMNFAEHASVDLKHEVLVFSLEMMGAELINRISAGVARICSRKLRDAKLDSRGQVAIASAYKRVEAAPLYIDTDKRVTVHDIRARAVRRNNALKRTGKKLGLVVVDYLQLMRGADSRMPREQQIAEMSRTLKILAGELCCPVLALSQLNRGNEKENREPRMSDMRESGTLEQDADVVILLHRPVPDAPYPDPEKEQVKLILAKVRDGAIGEVMSTFKKTFTKFENNEGRNA